jgi:hypothetical protein
MSKRKYQCAHPCQSGAADQHIISKTAIIFGTTPVAVRAGNNGETFLLLISCWSIEVPRHLKSRQAFKRNRFNRVTIEHFLVSKLSIEWVLAG